MLQYNITVYNYNTFHNQKIVGAVILSIVITKNVCNNYAITREDSVASRVVVM